MNEVSTITNCPIIGNGSNNVKNINFKRTTATETTDPYDQFIKEREKEKKQAKNDRIFNRTVMGLLGISALASLWIYYDSKKGMGQSKKELQKMWQDLKGCDKIQDMALPDSLKNFVNMFKKDVENPELIKRRGGKPIKAVLMHGPAGTGKTTFAKAIAQEFPDSKFASINMAKLDSEWKSVGDRNLSNSLDLIATEAGKNPNKKYFIFLDEIDSIMMVDNSLNAADSNRTLNVFKDMLENKLMKHDNIIVIGATNLSIDVEKGMVIGGKRLDEAMLSRFRQKILVDLPTAEQASNTIAKMYGKANCDLVGNSLKKASDKDLNTMTKFLTKHEHNVSFRTIESIVDAAAHSIDGNTQKVEMIDLIKAIKSKKNEIKYDEAEFQKLLKDLKINSKDL